MTLDLAKVSPQLRRMSQQLVERRDYFRWRLEHARATFLELAPRWEELRDLAESREHRNRRLASPREPLDIAIALPAAPRDHRVVATDGSQIETDRHGPAEYYLLNIGWAVLCYGERPDALLASEPKLAYELEDLFIMHGEQRRRVPVQGSHLAARRTVEELARAVELASMEPGPSQLPTVVLQDGTLLLWVLEERPDDFLRDAFLKPYIEQMRRYQDLDSTSGGLASYISRPRSTEVSALLRQASCGGEPASCPACSDSGAHSEGRERPNPYCALDGLQDRALFEHLEEGERSAIFAVTLQEKLEEFYSGQRIHFFFLHVGSELARVEVPQWVASDARKLDLVHAVVYDQCQRGQGYPASLTRAHEQAVVRRTDRERMRLLIESSFAQHGIQASFSKKAAAKRLRAV